MLSAIDRNHCPPSPESAKVKPSFSEIIGPASVYFAGSNNAVDIRAPIIDAKFFWLHPDARYNAGFQFHNCIFRDCSFQRITMFASIENFELWNSNASVN